VPSKKSTTSKPSAASGKMMVMEEAILIHLSPADRRKAQRCMEKNGKITFSVLEHSVTKLPQILENGKLID
jgi:hypothetical protein